MPYHSLTGKIWTRSNSSSSTFCHSPSDAPGCWSDTSTPGHTAGVVQDNRGNVYTYGLHVDGKDIGPYSVSYALNSSYSTFSGVCGYPAAVISPQWSPAYTKYFCVYGVGMLLYTSPRMNARTVSVPFEIPVSGVNILTIQYPAIDGPNEVATLFDGMVK